MAFTDLSAVLRWTVLCAFLGLTACATAPESSPEAEVNVQAEASAPSALPEGPMTPNPYEQATVSVSAKARADFDRALAAMEQGDHSQAQQWLSAMTEQYPALSGPWVNLAKIHSEQGRVAEAKAALEQALSINPNNLDAYNQLALLQREAGAFEAAEQSYRQALTVWPFHAQSHLNLGILLDLYRGEGEQALLHYRAYQQRQDEPDRRVAGWIVDLERRLAAEEAQ
ncbi:tetratricopeptide repeat protein [Marinimicrobium koreense]|uniref:tetratricopeptide repeat protein n=1 Tax=Marinimicrobium koreense TaxID=306545 RepID=UPI003F70EF1F